MTGKFLKFFWMMTKVHKIIGKNGKVENFHFFQCFYGLSSSSQKKSWFPKKLEKFSSIRWKTGEKKMKKMRDVYKNLSVPNENVPIIFPYKLLHNFRIFFSKHLSIFVGLELENWWQILVGTSADGVFWWHENMWMKIFFTVENCAFKLCETNPIIFL